MGILLVFVDGVGVGSRDPAVNPFATLPRTLLGRFEDEVPPDGEAVPIPGSPGGWFRAVDAALGVEGLPQSATGQAALLTGRNVPAEVGAHLGGLPGRRVRTILEESSIFRALSKAGLRATFANAYTPAFFEARRPRLSATTISVLAAGLALRTLDDLLADRAVYHDYTRQYLERRAGISLPECSAARAAGTLAALAAEHDFVLHEHFLTDLAAHRLGRAERRTAAARIEALLDALVRALPDTSTLLVATSDHGNLEDSRTRQHTHAPVPLVAWGPGARELVRRVGRIDELVPAMLDHLGFARPAGGIQTDRRSPTGRAPAGTGPGRSP